METEERITLWASRVDPSEQARVTSTKSCLQKFSKWKLVLVGLEFKVQLNTIFN